MHNTTDKRRVKVEKRGERERHYVHQGLSPQYARMAGLAPFWGSWRTARGGGRDLDMLRQGLPGVFQSLQRIMSPHYQSKKTQLATPTLHSSNGCQAWLQLSLQDSYQMYRQSSKEEKETPCFRTRGPRKGEMLFNTVSL